ncbi:hypothetical protein KJ975_01770 [Myxococcota bacterium]|nr:hypothetical protein [Myxococcota bacterium]
MKILNFIILSLLSLALLTNCSDNSGGGKVTEICNNQLDDDADGFADCDDQDCLIDEACLSVPLEICDNGEDDDLDGFADCNDTDCTAGCEYLETCDNNIDDDGDSFVDCDDQDCTFSQLCADPRDERCENGIDDDWDGLLDCDDPDCADAQACLALIPEICDNGIDDDQDGYTDCNDLECVAVCEYLEICDNGIDDDGDSFVDCDDQDCIFNQLCVPVEICSDTTDNDDDGLTSCLDPDCFGFTGCGECNPFSQAESGCGGNEFCYIDVADGYIPRCFADRGWADEGENCTIANDCRPDFLCFEGQCVEPCYPDVREGCDCVPFTELPGVENTFFGYCN